MVQRRGFNAAGALTSQKIAIAKRRFKDQRMISWQGVGPAIFLGEGPTGRPSMMVGLAIPKWDDFGPRLAGITRQDGPDDLAARSPYAERLHQALERDQMVDIDHVAGREDQRGNDRRQE